MGWGKNLYDLVRIPIKPACNGYYIRWWYNGWHYWFFLPGKHSIVTDGEKYRTIGTRKILMGTGQLTREQSYAIRTIFNTREIYLLTIAGWMNIRIEPGTPSIYHNFVPASEFEIVAIIGSKEISYNNGYSPVEEIPSVSPSINYCEQIIGNQTWMCENWKSEYPGSRAYNDDNGYRAVFGGLYTFDQIMSPGFCPLGWGIPSYDDWDELINYCGGQAVAGGVLKQAGLGLGFWNLPNTGAVNTSGFTARGGGYFNAAPGYGTYEMIRDQGIYLTRSQILSDTIWAVEMSSTSASANLISTLKRDFYSVRLIKLLPPSPTGTIIDIDGNVYHYITIGNQQWLVENLKTTRYNDGTLITNIINDAAWCAAVSGAYCWYNNDIGFKTPYGAMYNWYAINTGKLAPLGWRVPTDADMIQLINYLGGTANEGGKLKETGTSHWNAPNSGATNSSGFTGLPGGIREQPLGCIFTDMGIYGYYPVSDDFGFMQVYILQSANTSFTAGGLGKAEGVSVRCMRSL